MKVPTTEEIFQMNYDKLMEWRIENGYQCMWEGKINSFKIEMYSTMQKMFLVLRYKDGGLEVFKPSDKMSIDGIIEELSKGAE